MYSYGHKTYRWKFLINFLVFNYMSISISHAYFLLIFPLTPLCTVTIKPTARCCIGRFFFQLVYIEVLIVVVDVSEKKFSNRNKMFIGNFGPNFKEEQLKDLCKVPATLAA